MEEKGLVRQDPESRICRPHHEQGKVQYPCCHSSRCQQLSPLFIFNLPDQCRQEENMGDRQVIADSRYDRQKRTAHIHDKCSQIAVEPEIHHPVPLHCLLIQDQ